MPFPMGVASLTISQIASWNAAASVAAVNPTAGSAGPNWFQNWVSRLERSAPMGTAVPPIGPAAEAWMKFENVTVLPRETLCSPSIQNDLNVAGRPAALASPVAFVQVNWPAFMVRQAIGVAASPWNVTGSATASMSLDSVAVVAINCRGSSCSPENSGRRSRGCGRRERERRAGRTLFEVRMTNSWRLPAHEKWVVARREKRREGLTNEGLPSPRWGFAARAHTKRGGSRQGARAREVRKSVARDCGAKALFRRRGADAMHADIFSGGLRSTL